jgi:hypothetical protein
MRSSIALLFLLLALPSSAQEKGMLKAGFYSGINFYYMEGLRSRNQRIIEALPFDVKIIDNFIPRATIGSYIQYVLNEKFTLGAEYAYYNTGSRIGTMDYSGLFSYDQYVKVRQLGLRIDYSCLKGNHSALKLEMSTGAGFTSWRLESDFEMGDPLVTIESFTENCKGISWYTRPGLKYQYSISNFNLSCGISYSFEICQKFTASDKTAITEKTPSWDGVNLLIGIDYAFRLFHTQ